MLEFAWASGAPTAHPRMCGCASPLVTPRVKESVWHPTQRSATCPTAAARWKAQIAEWREMEPWVRGWENKWKCWPCFDLRNSVAAAMSAAATLYLPDDRETPA